VLFAVQAEGGRLVPKGEGRYSLTLSGLPRRVVGFSDRPRRDAFSMATRRFFGAFWRRANPMPPSVALDLRDSDNRRDALVLTVSHPRLKGGTLRLAAVSATHGSDLDHYAHRVDPTPPRRFGSASLFFDTRPRGGGRPESAPRKRVGVDLLFVTGAKSGRLDRGRKGGYELTLRGVRDHVVAFSDHPVDLSYNVGSPSFFGRWWRNLFSDSSPNAALDVVARSGRGASVALELSNPRLDGSVLRLDARRLKQSGGWLADGLTPRLSPLPRRFRGVSLFIDPSIGNPPNSSECRFHIRNRSSRLSYGKFEAEGTDFRWKTTMSGYGVPFDGVSAPEMVGTTVKTEGGARWAGEATQRTFGSLDHCSAKVYLNDFMGPLYTVKVTDYMLVTERHLPGSAECAGLRQYFHCEKSVAGDYYHECYYPTQGATEEAYCVEEWITTGTFVLCDEAPAFPPRHTCPSWVPPHNPGDDEPLAQLGPDQ